MRLIDADALVQMYEELKDRYKDGICCEVLDSIINDINNAPTIEPSGDLISREDAIEVGNKIVEELSLSSIDWDDLKYWAKELFDALPSADRPKVNSDSAEEQIAETEQKSNRPKGDPETEPEPVVAYICDRRRCAICSGPDGGCDHTTDIKHAAHFKNVAGQYFERPYMEEEEDG